jgi:hypothetical protein
MKSIRTRSAAVILLAVLILLAACSVQSPKESGTGVVEGTAPDLLEQAAADATAIVQRAQATALVLKARAEAEVLVQGAAAQSSPELNSTAASTSIIETPDSAATTLESGESVHFPVLAHEGDVDLLGVSLAADGGFIIVNFMAPLRFTSELYQGKASVTDEATGEVYNEIPYMPVIGPLIGRPAQVGQPSYVMLVNQAPSIRPGNMVTIVLGEVVFKHIEVSQ